MYQIIDELLKAEVEPTSIIFVRFDDPGISKVDFEMLETALYQVNPRPQYLFLDEIQEKKEWEKWVKSIYDLQQFKQIFLTGSSAALLSKELGTLLTGRHLSFQLMPFSFREYLLVRGWSNFNDSYLSSEKGKVMHYLHRYLAESGFPEAALHAESLTKTILTGIYNDIIFRDIISRHDIDAAKLQLLAYYLITNSGKEYSYRSLARAVEINTETAEKYVKFMQEALLIFSLDLFSYKLKTQFKQNKKTYCIDVGLWNAVSFKFSGDHGRAYENLVFLELKRRGKEIYYWKSSKETEVDFIIKEGLKITKAIQVCYNVSQEKTRKREIESLLAACSEFGLNEGLIITEDFSAVEKKEGITIIFVPLWKWLLEQKV